MLISDRLLIFSKDEDNSRYIPELYEVRKDELFQEYIRMPSTDNMEAFQQLLDRRYMGQGTRCYFGRSKSDESLVCFVQLIGFNNSLLYGVLPQYRNQGHGREILSTVLENFMQSVEASVRNNNYASQHCLEAVGFERVMLTYGNRPATSIRYRWESPLLQSLNTFDTERLSVTLMDPQKDKDVQELYKWCNDDAVKKYLYHRNFSSIEEFRRHTSCWRQIPTQTLYIARLKDNPEQGIICYFRICNNTAIWATDPAYRGNEYVVELIRAVLERGLFTRIQARILCDNHASLSVAKKCGFITQSDERFPSKNCITYIWEKHTHESIVAE